MNLRVKIGKLILKNPIVCSSGTFGFGVEAKGLADFSSIGAVVTKTLTLNPRKGNLPPRICELECGILNSIGLENPGLDVFIREKLPEIQKIDTEFIVSIAGEDIEQYVEITRRLNKIKSVKALEVNLSCPNLRLKKLVSQSAKATSSVLRAVRKNTDKVVLAKLSGECQDITGVARAAKEAGADGICLVNTFFGMSIDIGSGKPVLGNLYGGYSGRGIKPMSIYRVWKVTGEIDLPVIGGGGICRAEDALEFFLAGACAVGVGTLNLVNPDCSRDILSGIKDYMRKNNIRDVKELKGGKSA